MGEYAVQRVFRVQGGLKAYGATPDSRSEVQHTRAGPAAKGAFEFGRDARRHARLPVELGLEVQAALRAEHEA